MRKLDRHRRDGKVLFFLYGWIVITKCGQLSIKNGQSETGIGLRPPGSGHTVLVEQSIQP
jgi:hypothetical protein